MGGNQKTKTSQKTSPSIMTSQGTWTRSNFKKAHAFAKHLADFFSRIPQKMNPKRKRHLFNF
jgi:hypothetical protein